LESAEAEETSTAVGALGAAGKAGTSATAETSATAGAGNKQQKVIQQQERGELEHQGRQKQQVASVFILIVFVMTLM
jgi:hypothetical protein